MSKFLVLAVLLITLAASCAKPIGNEAEAHDEEPHVPHKMVCKDVHAHWERCENDEVICYEMNTRIWCTRR